MDKDEALRIGALFDEPVEEIRKSLLFPYPCTITKSLFERLKPDEFETLMGEDLHVRIKDLLHGYYVRGQNHPSMRMGYNLRMRCRDGQTKHMRLALWAVTAWCIPTTDTSYHVVFSLEGEP